MVIRADAGHVLVGTLGVLAIVAAVVATTTSVALPTIRSFMLMKESLEAIDVARNAALRAVPLVASGSGRTELRAFSASVPIKGGELSRSVTMIIADTTGLQGTLTRRSPGNRSLAPLPDAARLFDGAIPCTDPATVTDRSTALITDWRRCELPGLISSSYRRFGSIESDGVHTVTSFEEATLSVSGGLSIAELVVGDQVVVAAGGDLRISLLRCGAARCRVALVSLSGEVVVLDAFGTDIRAIGYRGVSLPYGPGDTDGFQPPVRAITVLGMVRR